MPNNNDQHRKDNYIQIRVTSREKTVIKKLARIEGTTVTDMIMEVLNRKISQANQQEPANVAA